MENLSDKFPHKKKKKKLNDKLIWIEYIINNGLILSNSCAFIYINIQIRWSSLEYYSLNWWKTLMIN